jgi:hypothetical protein
LKIKVSRNNWFPQITTEKVADQRGSFLKSAKISLTNQRKSAGKSILPQISAEKVADQR